MISKYYQFIERHIKAVKIFLWAVLAVWLVAFLVATKYASPSAWGWIWVSVTPIAVVGLPLIVASKRTNSPTHSYFSFRVFVREVFFFGVFPILGQIFGILEFVAQH